MRQSGSCGTCAFFDDHKPGSAAASHDGLCRFNPPVSQPSTDTHGLWPVVDEQDWCGHFAPDAQPRTVAAE